MKIVTREDVRTWYLQAAELAAFARGIGLRSADEGIGPEVDLPLHLQFIASKLAERRAGPVTADDFASLPFYSICHGLLLPLTGLAPERVAALFGIRWTPPGETQEELVRRFLPRSAAELSVRAASRSVRGPGGRSRPVTGRRLRGRAGGPSRRDCACSGWGCRPARPPRRRGQAG
jgi:hypothetical protein